MKKTIKTILCTLALAVLAVSCQKEINEVEPNTKETIEISINGLMGEYTQVDATKAELVNTVRVSWKGDETVFVFDGTECIGSLVASLDGTEDRYALLSTDTDHTVKAPATGTTKLTLVYSPLLTEAPAVNEGAISISLANQNGTKAPFVAYATLDYNNEETINNAIVPFKFATSVIKVNCTGLYANTAIDNATLSNVNTACKLTLSGTAAPTVAGDINGTITRTGDDYFAASKVNAEGEAVFQIAVPVLETASEARVLTVAQGTDSFNDQNFTTKSLSEATSVNTVSQLMGTVRVESVSLDKTMVTLNEGDSFTLTATVYPINAFDKSVSWSSSNEGIATVDDSGIVSAVSGGIANITVTTTDGSKTASCIVSVKADYISGVFTVSSAGKKVLFSPGNLWADGDKVLHFENNQVDYRDSYDETHVSLFTWSDNIDSAVGENGSGDHLFCDESHKVSVDDSEPIYYALSIEEWQYLFLNHSFKFTTVEGVAGYLMAPDGVTLSDVSVSYTIADLQEHNLVFLPAAGERNKFEIIGDGFGGVYWSASAELNEFGLLPRLFYFTDGTFEFTQDDADTGRSIRLVTDVTKY